MMEEALDLWREIEQKSGRKLIYETGVLWLRKSAHPEFKAVMEDNKEGRLLTAK